MPQHTLKHINTLPFNVPAAEVRLSPDLVLFRDPFKFMTISPALKPLKDNTPPPSIPLTSGQGAASVGVDRCLTKLVAGDIEGTLFSSNLRPPSRPEGLPYLRLGVPSAIAVGRNICALALCSGSTTDVEVFDPQTSKTAAKIPFTADWPISHLLLAADERSLLAVTPYDIWRSDLGAAPLKFERLECGLNTKEPIIVNQACNLLALLIANAGTGAHDLAFLNLSDQGELKELGRLQAHSAPRAIAADSNLNRAAVAFDQGDIMALQFRPGQAYAEILGRCTLDLSTTENVSAVAYDGKRSLICATTTFNRAHLLKLT